MSPARLAVPWYVHPSDDPAGWRALAGLGDRVSFVVVNVHNGPARDPAYPAVIARLRDNGLTVLGYVDTAYGRRPVREVADDVRRWQVEYDVRDVFFDCVAASLDQLDRYRLHTMYARSSGAETVAGNPGVQVDPEYLRLFDVTCVFEGTYADYVQYRPSPEVLAAGPDRVWHLVHHAPPAEHRNVLIAAAEQGAGHVYMSAGTGLNPWNVLPAGLVADGADGAEVAS